MGPWDRPPGIRRRLEEGAARAGGLGLRVLRVRRVSPQPQQLRGDRQDQERRVGYPGAEDSLQLRRQRAGADAGRLDCRGGDAGGGRGAGDHTLHRAEPARQGDSRDGDRAHGPRSEDVGAERAQPGARHPQSLRHRRRLHGIHRLPEPVDHLHGAHRPGVRLRRWGDEAKGDLMERRAFLGSLAAATVLPRFSSAALDPLFRARIAKVGIQLYTVRDLMKADFEGTLAKVAQTGYREVEFAGYFDHTPAQVRAVLDKNGLASPSCHVGYENTAEDKWSATLETVKAVGHQYVVCAWIPEESRKTADDWKRTCDRFNKAGQAAQAAGIQFAYHNHNFEFAPLADKSLPYDLLLAGTDPKLVQLEIDLFWITFAGADPVAYFMKNLGRVPMVHV